MIEKNHLNTNLITSLSSVLFMPTSKIRVAVDIPRSTWYRIMEMPDAITIQQLLAIANGLHVPVRRFFYTGDNNEVGSRDNYIIENYHPCHYDADALKNVVNNRPDVSWMKAAKSTGMSYQHLQKSLLAETRLPVTRLLTVCEAFELNPFDVIKDPNPPHANQEDKRKTIPTSEKYEAILTNITAVQREMANFKVLLEEIKRDIVELNKKLDTDAGGNEVQPIA